MDKIFDFGNSVMLVRQLVGVPVRQLVGVPVRQLVGVPEHQWIEKMKNIAKSNIFGFVSFRNGLMDNRKKGDEANATSPQVKLNAKIILQALLPPLHLL